MAEVQKPVVASEPTTVEPTVEPTPAAAPVADVTADKPAEVAEPKVEEPAKAEGETAVPVAGEEKKEETKEEEKKEETKVEKPVEPIYSGALGYKAPGLKNAFRFSKKYFWFGEEAVSTQSLSHYLRGEKAEVAHPTAAWSSQTGKGLLYFVKHADEKATPAGVLNLADAENVAKDGTTGFHFKLHGQKHSFETQTIPERNGWFVAIEQAVTDAKAQKETIVSSEGYKEELSKLGKPAALAATAAKESSSTPKKSTDGLKPTETTEPVAAEGSTPARAGSSSSSSSDEDKKKKKAAKSKSRSVSRGKRASIFGGFLGKKDKAEEKAEEKKEEKKEGEVEAKKEDATEPAPALAAEASTTAAAPVIPATEEVTKPAEESKTEEPAVAAPVVPAAEEKKPEEKKAEEKPKPTKRGSIFGNFVEKLKSPTTEKKESEVGPAVPAKEPETTAEAPKIEETPAVAPIDTPAEATTEAPKEEKKEEETKEVKPTASTPHKEKQHFSFGKFLGGAKEKVKSPTEAKNPLETAKEPKVEEPAKTEEPAAPVADAAPKIEEPATAAPVATEEKKEEATTESATSPATSPSAQTKRGSIFGTAKGLFRNASKAGRSKKEKEPANPPAKVEEAAEPKEETPAAPVAAEEKKEETPAAPAAESTEPTSIGDVVPDAVTVGQAPKSAPQVSTTA